MKDISYLLGKQWLFEVEQQRNLDSGVGGWVGRTGFHHIECQTHNIQNISNKTNLYYRTEGKKKKKKKAQVGPGR